MNAYATAQSAYNQPFGAVRTDRDTEYAAFARVTHGLKSVDQNDKSQFAKLAAAVEQNSRLWMTLFGDLMSDGNALPDQLRAQLASLALFVNRHTHAVLGGRGSVDALIEINTAVMKGLRSKEQSK